MVVGTDTAGRVSRRKVRVRGMSVLGLFFGVRVTAKLVQNRDPEPWVHSCCFSLLSMNSFSSLCLKPCKHPLFLVITIMSKDQ